MSHDNVRATILVAALLFACSSTSTNEGGAGAAAGGGSASGGGGVASAGGTTGVGGGIGDAAGIGANGGSAGSAAGGSSACAPPYAKELEAAVAAALPATFTWADFYSYETNAGCPSYAVWTCTNTPCAQCPITWKTVTPTSGKVFIDFAASCAADGKYGCAASWVSCPIAENGSGTVTLELGTPNVSGKDLTWSVTKATALGSWSGNSCSFFHQAEASQDLNTEMGKALPKGLAGTCP